MKPAAAWTLLLALAALGLAGCASSGSGPSVIDPLDGSDHRTGRTIHLKMQVMDYDQELYPGPLDATGQPTEGLNAWLWAFCVEPFDPNDTVSASVIEYMDRLPNDGTNQEGALRDHCGVPGPTIRVKQGDHVIVEFANSHVHPHTIHWHGQYVDPDADGAQGVSQQAVLKGSAYTYDFIAKRAGTLWYHCHVDAGFHVMQGLYGMFIVEPASQEHEPADIDHEEILVISTARRATVEAVPGTSRHNHPPGCFVSGTPDCQNIPQNLDPDVFLVNGHSFPYTEEQMQSMVHIAKDKSVRVRLLNAGNTQEQIHLHGHDMKVIAQDGVPLAIPYFVDTIPIGPAQRFDVVITGTNPGVWLLHTHVVQDETNDMQFPGGMHTMLVYDGFEDQVHAYPSELPGGMPYYADAYPPGDRTFTDTVYTSPSVAGAPPVPGVPTPPPAAGVNAQRIFKIEMDCAVKSIEFVARLDANDAALLMTDLHVSVKDSRVSSSNPGGISHFEADLGKDPSSTGNPVRMVKYTEAQKQPPDGSFSMPEGNWTITLTGSAAESLVTFSTFVDYYDSWEESLESHHVQKTPQCGQYGFGNQGREVGAPPV